METASLDQSAAKGGPVTQMLDALSLVCRVIAGIGLVIITLVQAWQVFGRYVLNDSPGWTEPVSVFFMALTVMMAGAVGVREGTHFAFPNVRDAMPAPVQKTIMTLIQLLTLGVALTLSVWGFSLAAAGWDIMMAGAPLPAGLRFVPVAIGGAIMVLFATERLVSTLSDKKA